MDYNSVNNFWFNEFEAKQWWVKDPDFDQLIRQRFAETHAAAQAGELSDWREDDLGRLAEIIVLDQFSRNMFRDSGEAFACDALALVLAQRVHYQVDERRIRS